MSHTPLPWDLAADGASVIQVHRALLIADCLASPPPLMGSEEAEANARLIVAAVNSHEPLLAALRLTIEYLDEYHGPCDGPACPVEDILREARAALAAAREVSS